MGLRISRISTVVACVLALGVSACGGDKKSEQGDLVADAAPADVLEDVATEEVDPGSEGGGLGSLCAAGILCAAGLDCAVDGTCQALNCPRGTPGCGCTMEGQCEEPATCIAGACLLPSMLHKPLSPKCYTPCRSGYVNAESKYVACPADGLMPGCLEQFECVDGSCLPRSRDKSDDVVGNYDACLTPLDCPDWQTCIQGKCYSICDNDMECSSGLECDRHVCRLPCDGAGGDCPNGMVCESEDGGPGHCHNQVAQGDLGGTVSSTFSVSDVAYTFTAADGRFDIQVTNDGPAGMTMKVTKVVHTKFTDLGPVAVDLDPLGWLKMGIAIGGTPGDDEVEAVHEIELELPAHTAASLRFLDDPEACGLDRWEGIVRVEGFVDGTSQGARWIHLRYMGTPEGRWTGTIHYFANFPAGNLAAWLENKDGYDIKNLDNALLKRWMAFKQGDVGLDEFLAVLNATDSESWKWSSVQAMCQEAYNQPNAACYLYADPWGQSDSGVGLYSQNLQQDMIPTAATALPFALNIRKQGGATAWGGRIESSGALHYPGNPTATLDFEADPSSCQSKHPLTGTCLTYVESFEADVLLGGRGRAVAASCDAYGPEYALSDTPWLVDGFTQGTAVVNGERVIQECRDQTLPFGDDSEVHAVNTTYSAANPVPNGLPLERKLRLVDGALVNQKTLLLFFQESFVVQVSPTEQQDFSTYGYMLLNRDATPLEPSEFIGVDQSAPGSFTPLFYPMGCSTDLVGMVVGQLDQSGVADFLANEFPTLDPASSSGEASPCEGTGTPAACRKAVRALASAALLGYPDSGVPPEPLDATKETAHYFCEDNGTLDYGPDWGVAPCPPGSKVVYFTAHKHALTGGTGDHFEKLNCNLDYSLTYDVTVEGGDPFDILDGYGETEQLVFALDKDSGGTPGSCGDWLQVRQLDAECAAFGGPSCCGQLMNGTKACTQSSECPSNYHCSEDSLCEYDFRFNVLWQCEESDAVYCDQDRFDLVSGKVFYGDTFQAEVMVGLRAQIAQAFRYKTKFVNKSGTALAFAPTICDDSAGDLTYCYDPPEIERARERAECLEFLYTYFASDLLATDSGLAPSEKLYPKLSDFLQQTFSYDEKSVPGIVYDGFERLYAELLIMMGDEAFSAAYWARFDIGGYMAASFPGEVLEPNGINLSGGAGYEMSNLYLAAQYYQASLDRFYALMPTLWDSFDRLAVDDYYVTQATAAHYFERLVRASGQKSRVWSEIARRYQKFNRPDLARRVVERAYTAGAMESIVFNGLFGKMRELYKDTADEAQIVYILEQSQLRYRQGLLEMRDVYRDLTNELTYFGYPPDYIPFPAVEPLGANLWSNAFDTMLDYAQQTMAVAAEKEALAINTATDFYVDYETFEAELAQIQASYETELLEICGSFEGDDGNIYPAVPRYADRSREAQELMALAGTLCGLTGDGEIHEALVQLALVRLDVDALEVRQQNLVAQINTEKARVEAYCQEKLEFANFLYGEDGLVTQANNLQEQINDSNRAIEDLRRYVDTFGTSCGIIEAGDIYLLGQSIALGVIYDVWNIVTEVAVAGLQISMGEKEEDINELQESIAWWQMAEECDLALIDSNAVVKNLLLGFSELELDALKAQYNVALALSRIKQLNSRATQLQDLQAEAEQNAINIVAAMNDPNVRLYKDDAILAADRTFYRALKAAYKATKVYEYYTSQTYAHLWDLFLVRAVSHGDYNLEAYLAQLEDAFYEFEESYGNPDLRVKTISLADDVLQIPYMHDDCGVDTMCTPQERADMLRKALTDPDLIDANGYVVIPFTTAVGNLSPLTYNHKLHCVEAELRGVSLGDDVARVYLRQLGTATVRSLDGGYRYYAFPKQTAVVDAWLNDKVFDNSVYQTFRFKDRPFANTRWELVINVVDEPDNLDVDLWSGLSDLRLHLYYLDFTNL